MKFNKTIKSCILTALALFTMLVSISVCNNNVSAKSRWHYGLPKVLKNKHYRTKNHNSKIYYYAINFSKNGIPSFGPTQSEDTNGVKLYYKKIKKGYSLKFTRHFMDGTHHDFMDIHNYHRSINVIRKSNDISMFLSKKMYFLNH